MKKIRFFGRKAVIQGKSLHLTVSRKINIDDPRDILHVFSVEMGVLLLTYISKEKQTALSFLVTKNFYMSSISVITKLFGSGGCSITPFLRRKNQ